MGGGASSSNKGVDGDAAPKMSSKSRRGSWSSVPVTFADLQPDGAVEHRLDESAIRNRGSISNDYGRISSSHQVFASQAALEAQASAHWHRVISHAKDQRNDAISEILGELAQKPRCPECARGNPGGPICRICGRDASQDSANAVDNTVPSITPGSSSPSAQPRITWNASSRTYDRQLVDRLLDSDSIGVSSPMSSPNSANNGSSGTKPGEDIYANVDFTDEDTHMQHILSTLLDSEGLRRSKDRKSFTNKLLKKATLDTSADSDSPASSVQASPSPLAALRKGKKGAGRRRFVGLGLDSDSDREDEKEEEQNHQVNSKHQDELDSELDLEEAGEAPDPELPPPELQLKRRTSTSITLSWDISEEMMDILAAVQSVYGKDKLPIYQVQYKVHSGTTVSSPSEMIERLQDKWLMGCKHTKDSGTTIEGLQANTAYAFRCIRKGWGDWGSTVVIRSGPGVPTMPKALVAKEVTSTSVLITWQVPEKDNGLPVTEYLVRMKPYQGSFETVFRGRERCYLTVSLKENTVHIFEVQAGNKAGRGEFSERLAVRTLPPGAAPMTPWTEAIDEKSGHIYYTHPKTNAVAWMLPKGALVDEVASFRSKRAYLLRRFEKRMAEVCARSRMLNKTMVVAVSRSNLLEDSLRRLYGAEAEELDGGLIRVRYQGEEGLDAGGLAKDWFGEVAKRLHDGSAGLLHVSSSGYIAIDPRAAALHKASESRWMFKAVGKFLAKAVFDSQTLGISLDRLLILLLCGREPTLDDLKESEPEFHKGLNWVLDHDVTGADLTYTCSYELFGESKVVELVPFGVNKVVDEDNKGEYVGLMQTWLVSGRYQPAMSHLLEGFHEHISTTHLQHFRPEEIQLLISGRPSVDVAEIRKDVILAGLAEDSSQVLWLWEVLEEEFDQEMLSRFVNFFSGCPCLPYDGLSPPLTLTVNKEANDSALPRAHTCFNQFVLPCYSSRDVLSERLVYALQNQSEGFFMA